MLTDTSVILYLKKKQFIELVLYKRVTPKLKIFGCAQINLVRQKHIVKNPPPPPVLAVVYFVLQSHGTE